MAPRKGKTFSLIPDTKLAQKEIKEYQDTALPLVKPKNLPKKVSNVWDRYIKPMTWLRGIDEPKCTLWCHMTAKLEEDWLGPAPYFLAQWRGLATELGMDPGSRARIMGVKPKDLSKREIRDLKIEGAKNGEQESISDRYFSS